MIDKLTLEQEAQLPVYRQKWLNIGLNCDAADIEFAERTIAKIYQALHYNIPKFIWVRSPRDASRMITYLKNINRYKSFESFLASGDKVENICTGLGGQHEAYWLGFYDYAHYVGIKYEFPTSVTIFDFIDLAHACGWWYPYDEVCIICDKPAFIKHEDERLHSSTGPAVEFRDGLKIYSWRGVRIPGEWVEGHPPTPKEIFKISNMELRHAACQIVGWHKILNELGGILIDQNENPEIGELWEIELPDWGKQRILRVFDPCGNRIHGITVDNKCKTALEANASTYGYTPQDFKPEFRL